MKKSDELFKSDMARYESGSADKWTRKFLYYFRKVNNSGKIMNYWYRLRYRSVCDKHGIEIPRSVAVGKGFYIGHPYNITINKDAVLGENVNIHKGVTIGRENRGKRKGAPVIGNQVWFGINSAVVGNIKIGDDVLIAPNSYVNCDVPSHSVVIGNPCKIISKENATQDYINRTV